jgi:hypothetical protein
MTQYDGSLYCEQLTDGLTYGRTIADIIINRFPDGFDKNTGLEIRKITDAAINNVIDKFTEGGVAERYRTPFAEGYMVGLNNRYKEYAQECAARKDSK